MDSHDKEKFFFDIEQIDWPSFVRDSMLGIRTYLMKDDPKTIPAASKRMKKYDLLKKPLILKLNFKFSKFQIEDHSLHRRVHSNGNRTFYFV
jgi:hypothetical protein